MSAPGTGAPARRAAWALAALSALLVVGCGSSAAVTVRTAPRPTAAVPAPSVTTTQAPAPAVGPSSPSPARPVHPPPAHPVPAAFRIARGAPSDAEVRRELLQLYAIERRQKQLAALSPVAANLLHLLPWNLEAKTGQVSIASVFRDYGLGLACGGVLGRNQLGVAHKTAPCGTLVDFRYGGRELVLPVIDRGPYIAGREWDLTGAAGDALRFPGLGQIQWSVVR